MTRTYKNQKKNRTKKISNKYIYKKCRSKLNKKKKRSRRNKRNKSLIKLNYKGGAGVLNRDNIQNIKAQLIRLIKIISDFPSSLASDILCIFRHLILIETYKRKNIITFSI